MIEIKKTEVAIAKENSKETLMLLVANVIDNILAGTHEENKFMENCIVKQSWAMMYNDKDGLVFGIKTKNDVAIERDYINKIEKENAALKAEIAQLTNA